MWQRGTLPSLLTLVDICLQPYCQLLLTLAPKELCTDHVSNLHIQLTCCSCYLFCMHLYIHVYMYMHACSIHCVPYFPDYKSRLNISRTPLFSPKIWEKFIDKSHLSISRTLFCYFLARRNVLGCIHVMRRLAKEREDAIDTWRIKPRWSRYHYCHLGGPELRAQHGTSGGSFPTLWRCVQ